VLQDFNKRKIVFNLEDRIGCEKTMNIGFTFFKLPKIKPATVVSVTGTVSIPWLFRFCRWLLNVRLYTCNLHFTR